MERVGEDELGAVVSAGPRRAEPDRPSPALELVEQGVVLHEEWEELPPETQAELAALTEYMTAMSVELGRAAGVSASKMRYQMARLRRLAATFEVQKQASLQKHAHALMLSLYPNAHLQERLLAGIWFLARYGDTLPALLIEHASQECPGHRVIYL